MKLHSFTTFDKLIFVRNWIALFLPLILITTLPLTAGDPTDPDPAEVSAFEAKLARLISNSEHHPHDVSDIIQTLEETLTKMVECPPTSELNGVTINIKTRHIKFDRNLMLDEMPLGIGANDVGWYQWSYTQEVEDGIKTITACNYIMLDSALMVRQEMEENPLGRIADEALLFHELLHGQLVIDSIMNNPSYQEKLCNCEFDLSAADVIHEHVIGLEETYIANLIEELGVEDPTVHVFDPEATPADEEGNFEFEVADVTILDDKENPIVYPYAPKGSNVDISTVSIVEKDGKLYVTGMLEDPSKEGLIVVIVDPPNVFLFIGLEKAIHILPAMDVIPTLSEWGIIILVLLLIICGLALISERKSNAFKDFIGFR